MKYSYRYIDRNGKKRASVMEADSLEMAKQQLFQSGAYVISIHAKPNRYTPKINFKSEQLALFTTQLAHLLNAGIPLYESLLSLKEQYAEEKFRPIVSSIAEQIKEGSSLAAALERFPSSFNQLYISMVEAGESVGMIAETLHKLAHLLQKQNSMRKQLLTALLYPFILTLFSLLLIVILLTFVVPSLELLFEGQRVNGFTRLVFGISHLITRGWWIYIPLFTAAGVASFFAFRTSKWRSFWQNIVLRTPIVKTVIIHGAIARFSRTMGTLLEGGVSIILALRIARRVMKQPLLEESIELAEKQIIEGSILSHELARSNWIPALVPRMLAIGEEGGNTAVMLGKIADLYEEEVDKILTRLAALAQPVILVLLGAVVGLIMLAILLPLTDVSGFMGGY